LKTLAHARDMILELPSGRQDALHWQEAADLLMKAAYRDRLQSIADARLQFAAALRTEDQV
jgi:hypothetical protein